VFVERAIPIGPDETAGELAERLAALAAEVTLDELPRVVRGELSATPQDHSLATQAPMLERVHGSIDWRWSSARVHDVVRGLAPRPSAFSAVGGLRLRVTATRRAHPVPKLEPGEVRVERPRVLVGTGDGAIELVRAQLEGKREQSALDLVNGRAISDGQKLGGSG
jgi:methionyl-tRNA formyltransferase